MSQENALPPFCRLSVAAMAAIRLRFKGRERTTAIAIYSALTCLANEQRRRAQIEATRVEIGDLAGTSDRTVDSYTAIFEELAVLRVERREEGGLHRPNLWTLVDPGGGEAASPPPRTGFATPGEAASPPITRTRGSAKKKGKKKTTPVVPAGEFDAWLAHHETVTGTRPPKPGTKARAHIEGMYGERRAERYSADELLLAVDGAWSDDFRRANGHYGHVSVLRPTKVHDLAEKGRRSKGPGRNLAPTGNGRMSKGDRVDAEVAALLAEARGGPS